MCRFRIRTLSSLILMLSMSSVLLADPATHLVVLLPGQQLGPGGVGGSPGPIAQREPFTVHVVAVDVHGNIDFSYEGALVGVETNESTPTPAVRTATTTSGAGAAPSIPPGSSLRMSLNGEDFRDYDLAAATTGNAVCASIEDAVSSPGFDCVYVASESRYVLSLGDGLPERTNLDGHYPENLVQVDPTSGVAPLLAFSSSLPPPFGPSSFFARRLVADPSIDLVFDNGWASFRAMWADLTDSGPGKSLVVNQGAGASLPVVATTFTVLPAPFRISGATALGDGSGRINRVRVVFNKALDPLTMDNQAAAFTLENGSTILPGTALESVTVAAVEHPRDAIEVKFGTGLGKTDVTDVQVVYTPPASGILRSSEDGSALVPAVPPLRDGAEPVLVSSFGQDVDGNNGLDRVVFFLSEPVGFSSARGVSISGYEPVTTTTDLSLALPANLRLALDGVEHTVAVVDPDDPQALTIDGGDAIARALTYAVRSSLNRPAFVNFTAEFLDGRNRLVLVPGSFGDGSSVSIMPAAAPDAAPALRLGPANGGVERTGAGNAFADLDDLVILGEDGLHSLLEGLDSSSLQITGNEVEVTLTNVPNSGTGSPAYFWKDSGDLGFVTDRASVPNLARPSNNVGLPVEFHPAELIRIHDTDSIPDDGILTRSPGTVLLDSSPSVLPLLASHSSASLSFEWTQVSGPLAVTIDPADAPVAGTELLHAGSYTFQLTVTALGSMGLPVFSADLTAEGTLTDRVPVSVVPGPATRVVILLPGQTLRSGVHTHAEAIEGAAYLATPGVPFQVRVTCTDAFFNLVSCPAAQAALETTEPGAVVTPTSQPLAGSEVAFTVHVATPGDWQLDDVLTGMNETDDVPSPYSTGTPWNVRLEKVPGLPSHVGRLTWDPDPRPVKWNVYAGTLPIADLDEDGRPDDGYGSCISTSDPNPADTSFDETSLPSPGEGLFYIGTMTLAGQETVPGTSSSGQPRTVEEPCP